MQVSLYGELAVAHIALSAAATGATLDPPLPPQLAVPLSGWTQSGLGTVSQNEYDPVLDAPTLFASPANVANPRLQLALLKRGDLLAPFRVLSMLVRDDEQFALEVRVATTAGPVRLRYEGTGSAPLVTRRGVILPVPATAIDGNPYALVSLDLAAAIEQAFPGTSLTRVLGIRLRGKFRVGAVVLSEPIT